MNTTNKHHRHGRWIQLGTLLVGLFLVLLLMGCVESSGGTSTQRGGAPTGATRPGQPKNIYSGEIRVLTADRYTGHPLRGVTVEVFWLQQGIVVNSSRIVTDEIGFGRAALAPVQLWRAPYDAVSMKFSLPAYLPVYQEQPLHWRLIGPLSSGADEWRFDVEVFAGL